ncbi:hypothetical protein LAZ67_1000452 [Cordylochernes scorpioides]|uniref:Uncharacterized protein n=1 Tax=Cordylochernes scorpioides TaxID=51811 RepID=A0ABY6JW22_9ARAC|nr:hypothetical protein LAZ67_1000452 [Cordylochernes scorpioides]
MGARAAAPDAAVTPDAVALLEISVLLFIGKWVPLPLQTAILLGLTHLNPRSMASLPDSTSAWNFLVNWFNSAIKTGRDGKKQASAQVKSPKEPLLLSVKRRQNFQPRRRLSIKKTRISGKTLPAKKTKLPTKKTTFNQEDKNLSQEDKTLPAKKTKLSAKKTTFNQEVNNLSQEDKTSSQEDDFQSRSQYFQPRQFQGVLDRLRFLSIKKMDQRTCIEFCVKNEIKCADAFRMLTVAYGEATLDRSNVYRW